MEEKNRVHGGVRRRDFLAASGAAAAALWGGPLLRSHAAEAVRGAAPLRIGIITDLHQGYAPDALGRLQAFMAAMQRARPDFIIEMGDFCNRPADLKASREVHACWEQFAGPRYHVLGNHDFDCQPKQQVMAAWGMKKNYYSFDNGPFHFAVLDCNYIQKKGQIVPWERGHGYGNLVPPEQVAWLREDLAKTERQTVIFSHQGLDDLGVSNRQEVRRVIAAANARAGFAKVIACICGHYHLDGASLIEGVHYLQINSASYYYVGGSYGNDGSARAAYRDPLFALATLDPAAGKLTIAGRKSEFRHPAPAEKKFPGAKRITASITDRELKWSVPRKS